MKNLMNCFILLAENDIFCKDAKKYANRLISSGAPTNVYTQWDVGHLAGNGARASTVALESLDVAVAALRGVFRRNSE